MSIFEFIVVRVSRPMALTLVVGRVAVEVGRGTFGGGGVIGVGNFAPVEWAPSVGRPLAGTTLPAEQTGVGRAVVDLIKEARVDANIRPITITGGHNATQGDGLGFLVAKKELVGTLQVLLQGRRLHVAKNLPEAKTLVDELIQFQVEVTASANETFGTWGEGRHDDPVLAVAIAAWAGENLAIARLEIWV